MICLVYVSSAILGLEQNAIAALVKASSLYNKKHEITGMLLYKGGNFMQLIEGHEHSITKLHKKIEKDNRHSGMMTLLKEKITIRNFDNWSMAYSNIDNLTGIDKEIISSFLDDDFDCAVYKNNPYRAISLLTSFKKNMR